MEYLLLPGSPFVRPTQVHVETPLQQLLPLRITAHDGLLLLQPGSQWQAG